MLDRKKHMLELTTCTLSMPQVHSILSRPEFATAVSWMPHGRAFKVHVPKEFENNILPTYFGHGR